MGRLPDFEGLAIFATVAERRSFAAAATELGLSKATVSKAVARLEARLGARLLNRTSRRLALTDLGAGVARRATALLADAEAAEADAVAQTATPRGVVRLAAPMSFGLRMVAPLLPGFLAQYPDVSVDLHLSDAVVDVIGDGFDVALRIGVLPDSSLRARRLCTVKRLLVGAPAYFARHGRPIHPGQLADHACFGYAYLATPDTWRFANAAGETVSVRPAGPIRVNNADALTPALLAGLGLAVQPDFMVADALAAATLETAMPDWSAADSVLHLLTPPGGPRPARVEALVGFLAKALAARGA